MAWLAFVCGADLLGDWLAAGRRTPSGVGSVAQDEGDGFGRVFGQAGAGVGGAGLRA